MGMQTRTITGFIARDANGKLYHYSEKPERITVDEYLENTGDGICGELPPKMFSDFWENTGDGICGELPPNMFPEITWEDEPRQIELTIKIL